MVYEVDEKRVTRRRKQIITEKMTAYTLREKVKHFAVASRVVVLLWQVSLDREIFTFIYLYNYLCVYLFISVFLMYCIFTSYFGLSLFIFHSPGILNQLIIISFSSPQALEISYSFYTLCFPRQYKSVTHIYLFSFRRCPTSLSPTTTQMPSRHPRTPTCTCRWGTGQ